MTGPSSNPRPRVDQLTDDQLDQLYARLERAEAKAAAMTAAMESTAAAALRHSGCHMKLMAQCTRAEKAEAELDALKTITTGYCPHCGRGDCSPTAQQWLDQRDRANTAEAAITRVRALHERYRSALTDDFDCCSECNQIANDLVPYPCPTLRALDGTTTLLNMRTRNTDTLPPMDIDTARTIKEAAQKTADQRHPDLITRYALEFVVALDGKETVRTLAEMTAPTPLPAPPVGTLVVLHGFDVIVTGIEEVAYTVINGILHVRTSITVDTPPVK